MHEFSIAVSIINIVENNALKNNAKEIISVDIEVGEVSGVDPDALALALESAVTDTKLEKSIINLITIASLAKCLKCSHEFKPDDIFSPCPFCGDYQHEIMKGKELNVRSINIE
jgi:hydrogenase nickel incorporation protein HypA/HybF